VPIRATTAGVGLALAALVSCSSPAPSPAVTPTPVPAAAPAPLQPAVPARSPVLEYTEQRLLATDTALNPPAYPVRTKPDGSWLTVGADDWTAGFYAATLWRTFERTQDPAWRQRAEAWQKGLASETTHDNTDLGFKIFDTYGVGYQLTGDESYKKVVLAAADTLARRYDPDVGMFRVWDDRDDRTQYRVNIDAMMNMELMFWAGQNGGNPQYAQMAAHHAERAMKDLVRPDGGTWMFAGYDQNTGKLLSHFTKQGYATESTWSRGQAWAVYGFTTAYRYTKDPRFLDTARRTAAYFVRRLPSDHVPYWDFDVPDKSTAPRDTSAAAVAASALLELSGDETDPAAKQGDLDTARDILTSLSSPTYAPRGKRFGAMLQHGTQHLPKGWKDSGIMFGDYYFVEALGRYEKTVGSTAAFMAG
jgi:unsaturated chondroitin disaccharide hydrolase